MGTQIFASYLSSPFPLPDEFDNKNFDFDNTSIQEQQQCLSHSLDLQTDLSLEKN